MEFKQSLQTYKRFFAYAKPHYWRVIVAMFGALLVGGGNAAMAKMVQPFVDEVLAKNDPQMVVQVPVAVLSIALAMAIGRYIQNYFIRTAGQLSIQDLRNDVFRHTMGLSMRYHQQTSTGDIMSGILNDIGMLTQMLTDMLVNALREGITLLALLGVAFYTDWKMSLVAFVVLPATAGPAVLIARKIKKFVRRSQDSISLLTTSLEQSCSGVKVVKIFGTEEKVVKGFTERNHTYYMQVRKSIKYASLSAAIVEIVIGAGVAAVLVFGMHRVEIGEISKGELLSIVAAILMLFQPVRRLVRVNEMFQSGMGAAERVLEMKKVEPEICDPEKPVVLEQVRGEIVFDHVRFAYDGDDVPALHDIDLRIAPGEVVALVGPSGAGKTTLVGMLCRFYDPNAGVISLDGIDLRQLSLATINHNITMVDQEAFLFNDSIRENIAYGRDANLDAVRAAARLAYADEFIEKLPDGYETNIGDRGLRLSGGQRQRISIARAICQDAPVLILDEATSALDTESEAIVQKAMGNLMQGRTTIVIAHRLSTVMNADRIVVMEAGAIREIGTHAELLVKDGLYKKLYDMQFKDE